MKERLFHVMVVLNRPASGGESTMSKPLRVIFLGWNQVAQCLMEAWSRDPAGPRLVGVFLQEGDSPHMSQSAPSKLLLKDLTSVKGPELPDVALDFREGASSRPKDLPRKVLWLPYQVTCLLEKLCVGSEEGIRYKSVVETARDAVVTIDESHRILFFNKAAEAMFGYSKEEVLGQDLSIIIPPPHKEVHREYVRRYVETRRGRFIDHTVDLTAQRRFGEEFPISISFSVAEVGGHLLMTAMMRDMSEMKEMERRLIQNERLASIGQALSFVTHEVKNPLVVIGGFARSLLRQANLPEEGREKLEIIRSEVQRLEGLLQEIQDFSKPLRLQKERIALVPFLEEILSMFRDSEDCSDTEFLLEAEGQLWLSVDKDRLRQVLINLIKNSIEAMGGNGKVVVRARKVSPEEVEIAVEDTGEGISPERSEELFQPFVTTKPGGTGLGLPLCRRIVRDHGGEIRLHGMPKGGARAVINLPLKDIQSSGEKSPWENLQRGKH
jgi:two-component system sensor kinase FixL